MSHVVRLNQLDAWLADKVTRCDHCYVRTTGTVVLCGWHETSFIASKYVKRFVDKERKQ